MRWQVFGPLGINDPPIRLSVTPKAKTVLGLLLCRCDMVVPVPALFDEIWGERPPGSARTTLQTYILHVRQALAKGLTVSPQHIADETLTTEGDGYRLVVGADWLDLTEFTRLIADAVSAQRSHCCQRATDLLQQALGLWKGPPLADVPCGPALEAECARLNQLYLSAKERLVALHLDLGQLHEALSEIAPLARKHPVNENMSGLMMMALHRAGRRPDALNVFHNLRSKLVDELAIEPGPGMQQLYRAVLASDPAIERPQASATFLSG